MINNVGLSKSLIKNWLSRSELLNIAVKAIFDPYKSNYLKTLDMLGKFQEQNRDQQLKIYQK
jgi:hypothetical protein